MSATDCAAKRPAPTRLVLASSATAFTPFSQNSMWLRPGDSGQAQPGQSKPSGWLTFSRLVRLRRRPISRRAWRVDASPAGRPPAELSGGPTSVGRSGPPLGGRRGAGSTEEGSGGEGGGGTGEDRG